jgi:hypothetical protein
VRRGFIRLAWEGDSWVAQLIHMWVNGCNGIWAILFVTETEGIWCFLGNLKGEMGKNIPFLPPTITMKEVEVHWRLGINF